MKRIVRYFLFFASFLLCYSQSFASTQLRISDGIAPFFDENKQALHYSSIPFYQLDTKDAPFVDEKQLEDSFNRYVTYLKRISQAGYTHISLDGFDHLLVLEDIGVYKNTTKYYRHLYYRQYYKKLIKEARKYGLGVFLVTDMQFYTAEIEKKYGLDPENSLLLDFNKKAFEEVLSQFLGIDGIILRFGEGGKAYNTQQYKSAVIYKTSKQIQTVLKNLLPIFEKYDKTMIVRTWTVGIGEVGDFGTNIDTYNQVFSGLKSKNLIASIKYTPGDFFAYSSVNPTIGKGDIPQIIEFQVRREYEGAGEFPNFIAGEFLQVYEMMQNNDLIVGCWNWNATGGWGWGKNMIFNYGFNLWNEINFWSVAQVFTGETDTRKLVDFSLEKLQEKYQFSPEEKQVLTRIILTSRDLILHGWYVGDFRNKSFYFLKNYIPPLLYIWWDRPTSSFLLLSLIAQNVEHLDYNAQQQILEDNLREWEQVRTQYHYRQDISDSLVFQKDLFNILFTYQQDFISWYQGQILIDTQKKIENIVQLTQKYSQNPRFSFDFSEIYGFYKSVTKSQNNAYIFGVGATIFAVLTLLSIALTGGKLIFKKYRKSWYFKMQEKIIHSKKILSFYILFLQLILWAGLYFFIPINYMYQALIYAFLGGRMSIIVLVTYLGINMYIAYRAAIDLEEKWGDRYIFLYEKYIFGVIFFLISLYAISFFPIPVKKYFLDQLPTYFYEAGSDFSDILPF